MVWVNRKKEKKLPDHTLAVQMGRNAPKGEVGLEVEVEGRRLPRTDLPAPWNFVQDGSLRGPESGEYVLSRPIKLNQVDAAVDALWDKFGEAKTQLNDSNRTSIHVHLNVLPFFQNRLVSLMALWFTVEDILTHWCGDSRVGNLFCQRAKDSTALVTNLREYVENRGEWKLKESHRYAALNAHSIQKFGSLEFRTLRGVTDRDTFKLWVAILRKLYEKSETFTDPRTLIENFSMGGPIAFFENLFGELSNSIFNQVGWSETQYRDSMFEGVRFAQDLCYARDWSDFSPEEVSMDPFGRTSKKVNRGVFDEFSDVDLELPRVARVRTINVSSTNMLPGETTAQFLNRMSQRAAPQMPNTTATWHEVVTQNEEEE
jgi:hypothetical protein